MTAPFLAVVVPAYNEAQRIAASLDRLLEYLNACPYTWEVIVVDDGSTDGTAEIVREIAGRQAGIRLLAVTHGGKGWAVRHGMLATDAEWRFMCDADLSMPPEQLERFIPGGEAPCEDVVIASRETPGARRIGEPGRRHLIGRVFTLAVRVLAFRGIEDTQCGFKLFRGAVAERAFGASYLNGFGFDVEVLFVARKMGASIREQPIDWYYYPGSKVTPLKGLAGFFDIARVRINWARGRYRAASASSVEDDGRDTDND